MTIEFDSYKSRRSKRKADYEERIRARNQKPFLGFVDEDLLTCERYFKFQTIRESSVAGVGDFIRGHDGELMKITAINSTGEIEFKMRENT